MRVGLMVKGDKKVARLTAEMSWPTAPPVDAPWVCCPRGHLGRILSVTWAGLDGEPALWVEITATDDMARHMMGRHGAADQA